MLRVTEIIKPLYGDFYDKLNKERLKDAREFGIKGHKEIEDYLKHGTESGYSNILYMFKQAQEEIGFDLDSALIERRQEIVFHDESVNDITGQPDYADDNVLCDWKFTNELREETALQLIAYDQLISFNGAGCFTDKNRDIYAFQYDKDACLTVYRLNKDAYDDLYDLFWYLLINHDAIRDGKIELYEALDMWWSIQYRYNLFNEFNVYYPTLKVESYEQLKNACIVLKTMDTIKKQEKILINHVKCYMLKEGIKVAEIEGVKYTLQRSTSPKFKIPKHIKDQYKIGSSKITKLVRGK